ncbi:MAG TPA: 50S ribosomal protein L6 [Alphaproteobacteria bacterium]|nr:50S ribosomal protein L6 [Rhodospirillaceae bacterium]HRJ65853.1 50S ribosomal protein L6 [Alphaproteobacteria bacterium]
MSRIAKHPIPVPAGVEVKLAGRKLSVKGKKGELSLDISNEINAEIKDGKVVLQKASESRHARNMWGTTSSLIKGMLKGVTEGYSKRMLIEGVGFRAALQGKELVLQIGYSHEVRYKVPAGIEMKVPKPTEIEISGIDKQKVGQVAAELYLMKRPEPYKGKGINYEGRRILRKEGKKK